MKPLKIIGLCFLMLIMISLLMFMTGCLGGRYDKNLLNELQGEILYLKRDEDLIIKLYQSDANLENEKLIYEHHDSIDNHNILDFDYDPKSHLITFTAYHDEALEWSQFELNAAGEVTPLMNSSFKESITSYDEIYNSSQLGVLSENGSLYLHDQVTDELTLLKKFYGRYEDKFSPGYVPLAISEDGNYVYYLYSKHATSIGTLLDGLLNPNYRFETYVMNVETKETSRYVDFEDIVFLD